MLHVISQVLHSACRYLNISYFGFHSRQNSTDTSSPSALSSMPLHWSWRPQITPSHHPSYIIYEKSRRLHERRQSPMLLPSEVLFVRHLSLAHSKSLAQSHVVLESTQFTHTLLLHHFSSSFPFTAGRSANVLHSASPEAPRHFRLSHFVAFWVDPFTGMLFLCSYTAFHSRPRKDQ